MKNASKFTISRMILFGIIFCFSNSTKAQKTLTINSDKNLVSITLPLSSISAIVNARNTEMQKLLKDSIYKRFKDDFDFIFFVVSDSVKQFGSQFYLKVYNDVKNIGTDNTDNRAFYGVPGGKLKGFMVFPSSKNIFAGATLHEIAHHWGNNILPTWAFIDNKIVPVGNQQWLTFKDANNNTIKSTRFKNQDGSFQDSSVYNQNASHWGVSTIDGQMGGFGASDVTFNSANTIYSLNKSFGWNNTGGNTKAYSKLELYLMGLAPESEVTPVIVYENITDYIENQVRVDLPGGFYNFERRASFKATPKTYSIADIQTLSGGKRSPNFDSSQKSFNVLTIVLTHQPSLTNAESNDISTQLKWFSNKGSNDAFDMKLRDSRGTAVPLASINTVKNFYQATSQRGTIVVDNLDSKLISATNGQSTSVAPPPPPPAPTPVAVPAPIPAPIPAAAVPTSGITFNGNSDAISLNTSIATGLSSGSAVTIEYWFKGTNLQSAVRLQGTSGDYIVAGWGGTPMHIISTDNGTNGVNIKTASSVNVHDNQWHHVAMTWEKNKTDGFKSYVDGVLVAKRTSGNVNLPDLTGVTPVLGAFIFNGARSEFTNGQLARVRIWKVARTEAQIIESRGRNADYANEANLLYQAAVPAEITPTERVRNCPVDLANVIPGPVQVYDNKRGEILPSGSRAVFPGHISEPIESCPSGSYMVYSTDGNWSAFSSNVPSYDSDKRVKISTRCICNEDTTKRSKIRTVETNPWAASAQFSSNTTTAATLASPAPSLAAIPTSGKTFNGTSDVASLNTSIAAGLSNGTAVTIEYWFKGTNLQSAVRIQGNPNFGNYIVAGWGTTPSHIISTDGGTNGVNIKTGSSVNVHDNQWHHVAMTWEKGKTDGFKSYVDGVVVDKRDAGNVDLPDLTGVTPVMGAFFNNNARSEFTNGQVARIRIWKTARTESQIIESRDRSADYPAEANLLYQGNGN